MQANGDTSRMPGTAERFRAFHLAVPPNIWDRRARGDCRLAMILVWSRAGHGRAGVPFLINKFITVGALQEGHSFLEIFRLLAAGLAFEGFLSNLWRRDINSNERFLI